MNAVFRITLDIHKIGSQAVIPCFQGDSGITIIASLTENGMPFMIEEGCIASFQALKPDGNYLNNACVIDNNTIVYDFRTTVKDGETCQTTAVPGSMDCQFNLIGKNGGILASPFFKMVVNKRVYNEQDVINSASEATALTECIADFNKKINGDYFDEKIRTAADTPNIWKAFAQVGRYYEAKSGIAKISVSTMILRLVRNIDISVENEDGSYGDKLGVESELESKVKIFVRDMQTDDLFFVNASDVLKAIERKNNGEAYPYGLTPIFSISSVVESAKEHINDVVLTKEVADETYLQKTIAEETYLTKKDASDFTTEEDVLNTLFPNEETREDITSQASQYRLPSDDVKVELEIDFLEQPRYIYMQDSNYNEPQMIFRSNATSPVLLPDDFADQELAATYWKAGNVLEAFSATKATSITFKKQEDKTAISPTRLAEILENEKAKIVEGVIAALPNAEEVSV